MRETFSKVPHRRDLVLIWNPAHCINGLFLHPPHVSPQTFLHLHYSTSPTRHSDFPFPAPAQIWYKTVWNTAHKVAPVRLNAGAFDGCVDVTFFVGASHDTIWSSVSILASIDLCTNITGISYPAIHLKPVRLCWTENGCWFCLHGSSNCISKVFLLMQGGYIQCENVKCAI